MTVDHSGLLTPSGRSRPSAAATTVHWELDARLDPLRSDTPRSAEVSMVADDAG